MKSGSNSWRRLRLHAPEKSFNFGHEARLFTKSISPNSGYLAIAGCLAALVREARSLDVLTKQWVEIMQGKPGIDLIVQKHNRFQPMFSEAAVLSLGSGSWVTDEVMYAGASKIVIENSPDTVVVPPWTVKLLKQKREVGLEPLGRLMNDDTDNIILLVNEMKIHWVVVLIQLTQVPKVLVFDSWHSRKTPLNLQPTETAVACLISRHRPDLEVPKACLAPTSDQKNGYDCEQLWRWKSYA